MNLTCIILRRDTQMFWLLQNIGSGHTRHTNFRQFMLVFTLKLLSTKGLQIVQPNQWLWRCWYILWRKGLDVTPISGIQSDRFCAIRIKTCNTSFTITGVYMPCAGTDIQNYGSNPIELECLVTEAQSVGCVCIYYG